MPEKVVCFTGRKVILRPPDKETDLKECLRAMNDPEILQFLSRVHPVSRREEEEWFDKLGKDPSNIVFAMETIEGVFLGIIGLHQIDMVHRMATTGTAIMRKDLWGKGYGSEAKMLLLNHAFNRLGLRKVLSAVLAYNERSLRYAMKCGYREEGRRRKQFWKQRIENGILLPGDYVDEVLLAVFREDWLPLWDNFQRSGRIS